MGMEKQGSKGGGFLQLFDWNKKSRKKLFPSNSDFTEGSKQGKKTSSSNLAVTRTNVIDEDENGRSSAKGSSDYSCSSSVTDDEENRIKAPGVVARLMGLDTLPTTTVPEPFSTPYFDYRSLRDAQYRRTPDLLYERQLMCSGKQPINVEGFCRNPVESRSQKFQKGPIERFQTEMLPPRSAKSISITHNKLFSPIKSPGYIPTKNAAQIMEEAAKIMEPGRNTSSKGKMPAVGSSSVPLKLRDLTEKLEAVQKSSRLSETSQRPLDSKAIKHLKGQSLNKSWNGEEASQYKNFPADESDSAGPTSKGKSISLAVQAKVNVQKRGGLSSNSSQSLQGKREHKDLKSNQSLNSHPNSQKNIQKKPSAPSSVLRQNNQKQNSSTSREKLPSKSAVSNQLSRKAPSRDASSGQNKPLSKVAGSSLVGQRRSNLDTNDAEKVPLSRAKNIPRKKRPMEGDLYHGRRSGFGDNVLDNNDDKHAAHPNVTIEGHSKWLDDSRRKGMDVVSFTFTSPMKKHLPGVGPKASVHVVEKHSSFGVDSSYENISSDRSTSKLPSLGLNVIGGDALNMLLEQKLRELTYGIESSSSSVKSMDIATSASAQSDLGSDFSSVRITSGECDTMSQIGLGREDSTYGSKCFSTDAHMLQESEEMGEHSIDSGEAKKKWNCRHPSPVSILEPCSSNESCNSSDSVDSQNMNDSLQCSSAQSQVDSSCSTRPEADFELADSASSTCSGNFVRETTKAFSSVGFGSRDEIEAEYVREVINNADFMFKDLVLGRTDSILNPKLFDKLESRRTRSRFSSEENTESRLRRRVLFDCVGKCLDLRFKPYAKGDCDKLAKGEAVMRQREWLAEDIYREISGLRCMGDWILDDLVDKDMSTKHGKWLDFDIEEFELGEEIGKKILSTLVSELVSDLFLGC